MGVLGGGICIEKWSQNFDSGTGSAIFGTPKIAKNNFWGVPKMALDTLGIILDPGKVIFGHFIFLVIFPLKFPLVRQGGGGTGWTNFFVISLFLPSITHNLAMLWTVTGVSDNFLIFCSALMMYGKRFSTFLFLTSTSRRSKCLPRWFLANKNCPNDKEGRSLKAICSMQQCAF